MKVCQRAIQNILSPQPKNEEIEEEQIINIDEIDIKEGGNNNEEAKPETEKKEEIDLELLDLTREKSIELGANRLKLFLFNNYMSPFAYSLAEYYNVRPMLIGIFRYQLLKFSFSLIKKFISDFILEFEPENNVFNDLPKVSDRIMTVMNIATFSFLTDIKLLVVVLSGLNGVWCKISNNNNFIDLFY